MESTGRVNGPYKRLIIHEKAKAIRQDAAAANARYGACGSLTTLQTKLIKIGTKVVRHGRYITFQLAEVAIPTGIAICHRAVALEQQRKSAYGYRRKCPNARNCDRWWLES